MAFSGRRLDPRNHTKRTQKSRATQTPAERPDKLIAAIRRGLKVGTRAVIKPVDLFLHLSRKTDSMQFVTAPQPPHGFTYFADFPKPGTGIAVFDIDARARLAAFRCAVPIVGNIARVIFDEIEFRQEAALDDGAGH